MATHAYQMAINYNVGGQFATNVLHFTFDDGGFTTTAAAARGMMQGWNTANFTRLRNILPTDVTILSYRGRAINQPGGFEAFVPIAVANTGLRAGIMQASGVGPVSILFPIGNGKQRGRIFWPGITDTDCVDGIITNALKGVLNTSLSGMITPFAATGGGAPTVQPVIFSRSLNASFNIFAAQTSAMVGQMRRRQLPV